MFDIVIESTKVYCVKTIYNNMPTIYIVPMDGNLLIIIILILLLSIVIYYYYSHCRTDNLNRRDLDISYLGKNELTIVDILDMHKNNKAPFITRIKSVGAPNQTICYKEFWIQSRMFAERLLKTVGPNSRVLLLCYTQIEWYIAFFGTMIANGIVIVVDPGTTIERLNQIIDNSKCDAVVLNNLDHLDGLDIDRLEVVLIINHPLEPNTRSNIIVYDHFLSGKYSDDHPNRIERTIALGKIHPEKIALIVYTNDEGDDNKIIKGVQLTHQNIICSIKNSLFLIINQSNITITYDERFMSIYPQSAISVIMMSFAIPLAVSGHIYVYDNSIDILDIIHQVEPTILIASNGFWRKISNKIRERHTDPNGIVNQMFINRMMIGKFGLDKIKYAINLGNNMSDYDTKYFKDIGIDVCNAYGFAETCGAISLSVPGCNKGAGIPLLDLSIDPQTSEINVRGGQVFVGYYGKKKIYKKNDWYATGKKGYIDRDGSLILIQ